MITRSAREVGSAASSTRRLSATWWPNINRARAIIPSGSGRWSISRCGRANSSTAKYAATEPRRHRDKKRGGDKGTRRQGDKAFFYLSPCPLVPLFPSLWLRWLELNEEMTNGNVANKRTPATDT